MELFCTVTVVSTRWRCYPFPPSLTLLSLFLSPSLSLSDPPSAHYLPPPPLPPVFQLETYLSEPQRLETRRLRSFSSPADATLSSASSSICISSRSASPPLGPGLQVWRLVSPSSSGGHRGQQPLEGRAVHQNIPKIIPASQWQHGWGVGGVSGPGDMNTHWY